MRPLSREPARGPKHVVSRLAWIPLWFVLQFAAAVIVLIAGPRRENAPARWHRWRERSALFFPLLFPLGRVVAVGGVVLFVVAFAGPSGGEGIAGNTDLAIALVAAGGALILLERVLYLVARLLDRDDPDAPRAR